VNAEVPSITAGDNEMGSGGEILLHRNITDDIQGGFLTSESLGFHNRLPSGLLGQET